MTRKPWAPTPIKAILTLSLGGTYPAPRRTRRGTIEKPIAAVAACARNLRRESRRSEKVRDRIRFLTVPPRLQLADAGSSWLLFVFFFQAEDGIRDLTVTGVQTCALPILTRIVIIEFQRASQVGVAGPGGDQFL